VACTTYSGAVLGVDGHLVRVEVDLVRRLPATVIVGLPSGEVRESVERVRSAILSTGLEYPRMRVTVNLGPADLRKAGTGFDLPIAVGILAASGQIPIAALRGLLFSGELSLGGELRAVRGALPLCAMAVEQGLTGAVFPVGSAAQAAVVPDIEVFSALNLGAVVAALRGEVNLPVARPQIARGQSGALDLSDVRGQPMARRALEIAAAGGHNLLMVGPPGVGKTMLASRLPSILPAMNFEEALQASRIHSVMGLLPEGRSLLEQRPFRAPHHSITCAGMIGGADLRPGEASLSHRGVLFLDEMPEFSKSVLELLRGPLEVREIVLSRSRGTVRFPAAFSLVASANPCPCGYLGHPTRPCRCGETVVRRYQSRISGPLIDRMDLNVAVEPIEPSALFQQAPCETSAVVRDRVEAARERQRGRFIGTALSCNADMDASAVRSLCELTDDARKLLCDAVGALSLSGRGHDRVLKVARTIADLAGGQVVEPGHIAEAVAFRGQEAEAACWD